MAAAAASSFNADRLQAVLPLDCGGLGGKVLYINTEDKFPTPRLKQIARGIAAAAASTALPSCAGLTVESLCDRIIVTEASETLDLQEIMIRLPALIEKESLSETGGVKLAGAKKRPKSSGSGGGGGGGGIKLIILDSVAAIFRSDAFGYDSSTSSSTATGDESSDQFMSPAARRSRVLMQLAAQLKALNARYGVIVIVVNQASDIIDRSADAWAPQQPQGGGGGAAAASHHHHHFMTQSSCAVACDGRFFRPALGAAWDACVNTRIILSHSRSASRMAAAADYGAAAVAPQLPFLLQQRPGPSAEAAAAQDATASSAAAAAPAQASASSGSSAASALDPAPAASSSSSTSASPAPSLQPLSALAPPPPKRAAMAPASEWSYVSVTKVGGEKGAGFAPSSSAVRCMHVVVSCAYPPRQVRFVIEEGGPVGLGLATPYFGPGSGL